MKEQTQELIDKAIEENGFMDWAKAQEISSITGDKPRSIVASVTRNKLPYKRQERTSKDGSKIVSKTDLVASIADSLNIEVDDLYGLDKAAKTSLEAIVANLKP